MEEGPKRSVVVAFKNRVDPGALRRVPGTSEWRIAGGRFFRRARRPRLDEFRDGFAISMEPHEPEPGSNVGFIADQQLLLPVPGDNPDQER